MALHRAQQAGADAFVESFNGRLRDECLNEHVFRSLSQARGIVEAWRIDYNTVRPLSSLGGLAPSVFANRPSSEGQNWRLGSTSGIIFEKRQLDHDQALYRFYSDARKTLMQAE